MVVLLFLFSPVLVELVDFHSGVALLYQVKGLRGTKKKTPRFKSGITQTLNARESRLGVYLVNFTEAPSSQKVQEQVSLIQRRVIFKSAGRENSASGTAAKIYAGGVGGGRRPLDASTLARRVHRVPTPMRRPSEEWTRTHCELSSLFILFSSRM